MTTFTRKGSALWKGGLRNGNGTVSAESQALVERPYSFNTRFGDEKGTNPEELIAAAHAACYSMAFAATLERMGYQPKQVATNATCSLVSKEGGGFEIKKMQLNVRGEVPGINESTFKQIAMEADKGCPLSNLLRNGLEIEIDAQLM